MAAFRIFRRLRELLDVDPTGIADGDVPTYATAVSKFTMAPPGAAQGHSVTLSGNTAGVLALIATGTMTLAGGSNITLSQVGNAVTISGGAGGGAQTFLGAISASDALYTSGTVRLTGVGGGVTVSSNTGQRVDISVAAPVAQSVQPETQTFVGGVIASDTTYTSGSVRFTGVGGGVTVSSNTGQRVDISVAAQSVQPETQTFVGAVSASDALYTSGTVRVTGVGGGITVSSNTGQRIDLSVAAPVAQTVQTQNVVDLTLDGNTAGALALVSSGTATLAGGNNITLSQAGNAITISGPNVGGAQTGISGLSNSEVDYTSGTVKLVETGAITIASGTGQRLIFSVNAQSVQPETQTFIAGVSASDTLYTSGNVRITGVGGGVTVSSNTGQRVDISVAAQSVQAETQTFIGGISASDTLYTSGSVRFTGSQAVTVRSGTGQLVVIDAPAQSVQAETQTFIAGISASDTLYTSGNVRFTGLGAITVGSNTGQRVDLSVAAQTNQAGSVYASSNTFGTSSGTYDARSISIAGRGAVSVAASNSGWIISAPVQSVQAETQTAISGIGNSETTYTSGTVNLSVVGGALTIRSTTGNAFQFSASQSVQAETQTFVGGISASDTVYTSGTVKFSGVGGGITVSSNTGQRVDLSVAAAVAQTNQSGNVYASSNTFGTSSGTYDARSLSVAGAGIVSVAASNSGWVISASVAAQTNQSGNVYASSNTFGTSSGTYDARSISIAGSGNVSVAASNSGWVVSVPAQTNQSGNVYASSNTFGTSSGTYDARSLSIAGRGIVSVAASNSGWIISASQSVQAETQTFIGGLSNSNTTYTSGTVGLSELGAITIRSTTGNQFQFSVNSQTNQTGTVYAASNTFGTSSGTYDARTLSIAGDGIISVAASNSGYRISATQSVQTQGILNVALSNIGNTSGDTGINSGTRLVLAGGNNITLSASSAAGATTITISAPNLGAGAMSVGVSTGGNTAGSTGITGTRLVLVGTNNISLSQSTDANGGTISINNTVSAFQAGMSTDGNTAGNTGVTGTRLVLVGSGPVSLSQTTGAAGATLSINAPATSSLSATGAVEISSNGSTISIGAPNIKTMGDWQNFHMPLAVPVTLATAISKTPFYWNDEFPAKITAKSLVFRVSLVTASQPLSLSAHFGVYTMVNSTSAALLGSVSEAWVVSSASSVSLSGVRNLVMSGIGTHATLSAMTGGDYLFGMMLSATASNAMNFSLYGAGTGGGPLGVIHPGTNQLSTATSQGMQAMAGRGSTTVNAMPANVQASEIVNQGQGASMQIHPWIYIRS